MKHNCSNCEYFDKRKKRKVSGCYQYGCSHKKSGGWIPSWTNTDKLLEDMICRHWMAKITSIHQVTIDEYLNQ